MPLVPSTYQPPLPFRNAHFATIFSAKLRRAPTLIQERERLQLPDGDFIDMDWSYGTDARHLALLLHGLEGNAQRPYIRGQAHHLNRKGIDVVAVNFRGCSGTPNKRFESYNAGKTDDLEWVIQHILKVKNYQRISLIGFSLGGNMVLKYLGEGRTLHKQLYRAAAISTPLDLHGSLQALNQFHNIVYRKTFLKYLRKKYRQKQQAFPNQITVAPRHIKTLIDFDEHYTAPAHGFSSALAYYNKSSSMHYLSNITLPVYLLNAKNDTFLSANCYPTALASQSKNIYLETPLYGGHVGFYGPQNVYYNERRTTQFLVEPLAHIYEI
ncbi:YheT family hydrolase [Altibacter sp. HG106]|uniref:YheT family hydrolase n=1 Tax=Altibacter sp. HG106 TaxID=3023937 RepID=UPI002350BFE7|nr:alpha/beta fold hydrolase [Altibacter sp. HG106]MDC7994847.1 alpha/beta fold hydrolase [Altibacter sp. HG106]